MSIKTIRVVGDDFEVSMDDNFVIIAYNQTTIKGSIEIIAVDGLAALSFSDDCLLYDPRVLFHGTLSVTEMALDVRPSLSLVWLIIKSIFLIIICFPKSFFHFTFFFEFVSEIENDNFLFIGYFDFGTVTYAHLPLAARLALFRF